MVSNIFVHHYLGKWSHLTNIDQMGWFKTHQLENLHGCRAMLLETEDLLALEWCGRHFQNIGDATEFLCGRYGFSRVTQMKKRDEFPLLSPNSSKAQCHSKDHTSTQKVTYLDNRWVVSLNCCFSIFTATRRGSLIFSLTCTSLFMGGRWHKNCPFGSFRSPVVQVHC